MAGISLLAHMELQLEATRRQIRDAAIDSASLMTMCWSCGQTRGGYSKK